MESGLIKYDVESLTSDNTFYGLNNFYGLSNVFIKLEGLNIAGSIKLKTAIYLVNGLEETIGISPQKNTIIESSSGNLGIALSIVCKSKGYKFICVTDPNTSLKAEQYMQLYGAKIIKVTTKDKNGGYLGTRIDNIKELLARDPDLIWTNQYSSKFNIEAHYNTTAKEILDQFPQLQYLFIGAGTTGTLAGCAQYFKKYSPNTKVIAIDTYGSVTFGYKASPRFIPGLGTSHKPAISSTDNIHKVLLVKEQNAVFMCNYLLKNFGLFLGGSSGSVLYAIRQYLSNIKGDPNIVAISPDFGDKYVQTIYNTEWVKEKFACDRFEESI